MKKVIKINIDTPCSENWESFPKTVSDFTVTGHCASCSKNVIDFTTWNDERIKAYFKARPQNVCGRLASSQLKVYELNEKHKKPFHGILTTLMSILLLFATRLTEAQVQNREVTSTEQVEIIPAQKRMLGNDKVTITGRVVDEEGYALPGVNVIQKGVNNGAITNVDGEFSITLTKPQPVETLVFAFIGLKTEERTISTDRADQSLQITMELDTIQLSGEVIVGGVGATRTISPRRWWWNLKGLFRRY